jgi:hypothetical protein
LASWEEVKKFVHDNFVVEQDLGQGMRLLFSGDTERTQLVFLTFMNLNNSTEEWLVIESPVGKAAEIDLALALTKAGDVICGGLGLWGADPSLLMMRHAVPLENLDANELVRPMQLLAGSADRLEQELTLGDRF